LREPWLAAWKQAERNLLVKLLAEVPAYRLVLPFLHPANDVKSALLPVLEKLVDS
jgi:hypothetical protein